MEYIYGKLNKETILTEYKGISTSNALTEIDNLNHTIKVTFLDPKNGLLFNEEQSLNNQQLKQLYSNFKLTDYSNLNLIQQRKENQAIEGNLTVKGDLSTTNRYLIIQNQTPLKENEDIGIIIKNWQGNKDAKIYLNEKGELRLNTETIDQQILTKTEMDYDKFTIYNGRSLSTRDIFPKDINTENYEPQENKDLITKEYLDQIILELKNTLK